MEGEATMDVHPYTPYHHPYTFKGPRALLTIAFVCLVAAGLAVAAAQPAKAEAFACNHDVIAGWSGATTMRARSEADCSPTNFTLHRAEFARRGFFVFQWTVLVFKQVTESPPGFSGPDVQLTAHYNCPGTNNAVYRGKGNYNMVGGGGSTIYIPNIDGGNANCHN